MKVIGVQWAFYMISICLNGMFFACDTWAIHIVSVQIFRNFESVRSHHKRSNGADNDQETLIDFE